MKLGTGEPTQGLGLPARIPGGTPPENGGPWDIPGLILSDPGPACGFEVPWGAHSSSRLRVMESQQWLCLYPRSCDSNTLSFPSSRSSPSLCTSTCSWHEVNLSVGDVASFE